MGSPEQFYRNPDHGTRPTPEQRAWAAEQERKRKEAEAKAAAKAARDAYENELYDEAVADRDAGDELTRM
jgi:hypothetical protein